ncbi:MAG: hypothetical protein E6Q97_35865 [Desulfurellales bacterium]|nr:MAG: hypothetical protein E6Q97_35865 [Desulfurellales bacterium]
MGNSIKTLEEIQKEAALVALDSYNKHLLAAVMLLPMIEAAGLKVRMRIDPKSTAEENNAVPPVNKAKSTSLEAFVTGFLAERSRPILTEDLQEAYEKKIGRPTTKNSFNQRLAARCPNILSIRVKSSDNGIKYYRILKNWIVDGRLKNDFMVGIDGEITIIEKSEQKKALNGAP